MRITYNIFWVEDNTGWFDTAEQLFKDTLEDWGFRLHCKRATNLQEVKKEIEQGNQFQDYDLLLIDLKLNNNQEEEGNKVIELIRERDIYTDIIFYSSEIDRIYEIMQSHRMEGVYTSDRANIETKFEKVAKTTIKKVQEVNAIRGLLMAETSDLDDLMLEIIKTALDSDIAKSIETYILKKIRDTAKDNNDLAHSNKTIQDLINSRVFTATHIAKTVGEICKKKKVETVREICKEKGVDIDKFFQNYERDIINKRNIFAHVKERTIDGEKVLISAKTGGQEAFDDEKCNQIRKTLIDYRDILEKINDNIFSR